jgi:hypothetical protein
MECFLMNSKVPRWNIHKQEIPQTELRKEVPATGTERQTAVHAPPAAFPDLWNPQGVPRPGPIYGLARQNAPPSHDCSQWLDPALVRVIGTSTLAYRCGGSTGISPVSRLTG